MGIEHSFEIQEKIDGRDAVEIIFADCAKAYSEED